MGIFKRFLFSRLKFLIDRYPNDMELGNKIRELYHKSKRKNKKDGQ
jgi:hypothetical protein